MILFFMSRKAEDAHVPEKELQAKAKRANYRPAPRHKTIEPTQMPEQNSGEGAVTRDEMTKLFGNALRVR
ncbi:hypothetical protein [Sulfitobacter donghicola]|uniref:hypothetical protein n=1 Tax=Sulfitobacter donghicola TaxID=421000 RepID=UPI0012DD483B|nr:hypothetical protein [Sulfitobacter donghicola]